jgi:two-component system response regulator FixJ
MMTLKSGPLEVGREMRFPVYVVDDNREMCLSIEALLSAHGYVVQCYESPLQFLDRVATLPGGVLLVDLRMEELDGIEVIRRLEGRGDRFPAIMITAHGDIEVAVKAIKLGARDFIQKPFRDHVLMGAIDRIAEELAVQKEEGSKPRNLLTGREREVAERLAKGLSNKQIAYDLGISVRTVEMHRLRAMQRLGCKSLADLLRILLVK